MSEDISQAFQTRALHTEAHVKPFNSHVMPIFQTSTFYFDSPEHGRALFSGEKEGHIYSRLGNPTVESLEDVIAKLEEGYGAITFSSGMGAIICSTMPFLKSGDHMIAGDTLYGCTVDLFLEHFPKYNIKYTPVDTSDINAIKAAATESTKLIFLETPANPTNRISDIRAISEFAHSIGALFVIDSTFATPYFQRPLVLGADMVLHSMTKYIGGHGDLIGGVLVTKTEEQLKVCRSWRKVSGGILGPYDAFLAMRGVKTLAVRMEQIQKSSMKVAEFLEAHPSIEKVYHPGLESFSGHQLAKQQMSGFGGTFSFTMKGGYDAAKRLLERVKLCSVAVSLGSVDTLIQHPASMTHACVPEALMIKQGLTRSMVRISVGLECYNDIINDLDQAMKE